MDPMKGRFVAPKGQIQPPFNHDKSQSDQSLHHLHTGGMLLLEVRSDGEKAFGPQGRSMYLSSAIPGEDLGLNERLAHCHCTKEGVVKPRPQFICDGRCMTA